MSGERSALRAADHAARRLAQSEFVRPLVLEAGAGTGKTTALVGRLLAWCLGPGWERAAARRAERGGGEPDPTGERTAAALLAGVVAITFTEAAAAEMAERAGRELARLAAGGEPPGWLAADLLPPAGERTRRARALAATLDRLTVRTIHAFCRSLLADHPLEAGLHPAFTVDADGLALEEVVRETVEPALRRAYEDEADSDLLRLAARGIPPQQLADALTLLHLHAVSADELAAAADPAAEAAALVARLAAAVAPLAPLLAAAWGGDSRPNTKALRAGLARLAKELDRLAAGGRVEPSAAEAAFFGADERQSAGVRLLQRRLAVHLPENLLAHLRKLAREAETGKPALPDAERETFRRHTDELCRLARHLATLDPELLAAARGALAPLLAEVERGMRARGAVTYDGLLEGAVALLARHPGVRARVRRGIDQLLVDEFQDTDRVQCELLRWLALDGPPGAPSGAPPAPNTKRPGLFLVGDPKQSIYGWRSADLAAYDAFVAAVREAGGEVRPLAENFRSVPAVLDEVTRIVEPVLRERTGVQPRFEPLLACERLAGSAGYADRDRRAVEHWVSWPAGWEPGGRAPSLTEATELEAAALARDLLALRAAGVRLGEVAILLRSGGDLDVYLEALRRAGVPFLVGRDKQYYRRREVIEAAALVRAVLDPGDHLALLTVLRSALVGVPDAALVPLWRRQLPRRATELGSRPAGRGTEGAPSVDWSPARKLSRLGAGHADEAADREALAALAELVEEAAREVPAAPGLERIAGWERGLIAGLESLAALRRSFARDPVDVFVDKLRALTLLEPVEAARTLGAYRLANLERFFRELAAALEAGGGDATAVLRSLRRSVAAAREAEEARPQAGLDDAVQVLTIHGAKGLDFRHVYVAQLHKQKRPDEREPFAFGRVEGRLELSLFGAATSGFDRVEAQREEVEAAERVRLLYVATTRAKERLVLLGCWPEAPVPRPPDRARSLLDLAVWRTGRPEEGLDGLWGKLRDAGEAAREDAFGALWRFPALGGAGDEPEGEREAAPWLATPAEAARQAEALHERRAAARARMARPFGAPASAEAHERLREERAGAGAGEGRWARRAGQPSAEAAHEAALAAGSAVHSALESWDLEAEAESELARQLARLPGVVEGLVPPVACEAALSRAHALLTRAFSAGIVTRLRALRESILARELPVLLPPVGGDGGPVGYVAGTIDLLYQATDGSLVVADYKTDQVEGTDLAARAAVYAPQGAAYTRAVQEALGLTHPPRFELWFLAAGEVVQSAVTNP